MRVREEGVVSNHPTPPGTTTLLHAHRPQENMQKHMLGRAFWMQLLSDKKLAADVDAYKRSHGGVSPPVPLSHRIKRTLCCSSRLDPYRDSSLLLVPVSRGGGTVSHGYGGVLCARVFARRSVCPPG